MKNPTQQPLLKLFTAVHTADTDDFAKLAKEAAQTSLSHFYLSTSAPLIIPDPVNRARQAIEDAKEEGNWAILSALAVTLHENGAISEAYQIMESCFNQGDAFAGVGMMIIISQDNHRPLEQIPSIAKRILELDPSFLEEVQETCIIMSEKASSDKNYPDPYPVIGEIGIIMLPYIRASMSSKNDSIEGGPN